MVKIDLSNTRDSQDIWMKLFHTTDDALIGFEGVNIHKYIRKIFFSGVVDGPLGERRHVLTALKHTRENLS